MPVAESRRHLHQRLFEFRPIFRGQPLQVLAKPRKNEYPDHSFPEKLSSLPERRAAAISFSAESSAALASSHYQLAYLLSSLYNPFQ